MEIKKQTKTQEELKKMGVFDWPTWSHEPATFPWEYTEEETCYILEGRATVRPEGGDPVEIGKGDFVTFPKGMKCTWTIHEGIRKHYNFT